MKSLLKSRLFMATLVFVLPLLGFGGWNMDASAQNASAGLKYKVGDTAPDFTLRDQNGKNVSLHDFRGKKNVALAFYIFAFSGG